MGFKLLRNPGCLSPQLEARKEVARLGALIGATGFEYLPRYDEPYGVQRSTNSSGCSRD